jgi:hypothetical protein
LLGSISHPCIPILVGQCLVVVWQYLRPTQLLLKTNNDHLISGFPGILSCSPDWQQCCIRLWSAEAFESTHQASWRRRGKIETIIPALALAPLLRVADGSTLLRDVRAFATNDYVIRLQVNLLEPARVSLWTCYKWVELFARPELAALLPLETSYVCTAKVTNFYASKDLQDNIAYLFAGLEEVDRRSYVGRQVEGQKWPFICRSTWELIHGWREEENAEHRHRKTVKDLERIEEYVWGEFFEYSDAIENDGEVR